MRRLSRTAITALCLAAAVPAAADEPAPRGAPAAKSPAAPPKVDYLSQIKPILTRRCVSCHGHLKQESSLRVDAARYVLQGGERGPAVVAGDPERSVLVSAVSGKADFQMPPEGEPLSAEEIGLIRRWVAEGAAGPADEKVIEDPSRHWAFLPPVRPAVPVPANSEWVRNPIDAFVAAAHEAHGLKPVPDAPRNVLLRRVSLDLTGLPPTPEELRGFLADDSPEAYARAVDRLLDSPRYGERWARHWMDVWRYSDWYGYQKELRNSVRHIWRWRDWIIESLNDDKPYDRMVMEMLAADEIAPDDPQALRATGYLARSYYKFNRNVWLDNAIEHTSKALLGITMNCARCHDHMYDPIAQSEYYQFRAIFEPYEVRIDPVAGQTDPELDGLSRVFDAKPDAKTFLFVRGDEKSPEKDHPLEPALPALFANDSFAVQPVSLPPEAHYPGLRSAVRDTLVSAAKAELAAATEAVDKLRATVSTEAGAANAAPASEDLAAAELRLAAAEASLQALNARIAAEQAKYADPQPANVADLAAAAGRAEAQAELRQAEAAVAAGEREVANKKAAVKEHDAATAQALAAAEKKLNEAREKLDKARAAAAKPSDKYAPLSEIHPASSTGRRTALARAIVDRKNPLAARVAVNHIWLRHFGQPLVPTVFDFGLNGKPPSHPELLDWLAVELMENGWRMKHIHRLIVLSRAYQLDSISPPANPNPRIDADNVYLWRMNSRRAEAEIVRDSVLWVAGQLDLTQGGPELDSNLGATTFRRSVYYRHAPEKFMTFLKLFDSASTTECYQRRPTIVPQQALAMFNSPLSIDQARRLAARVSESLDADQQSADDQYVSLLFERLLCRPPSDAERAECRRFLNEQSTLLTSAGDLTKFTTGAEPTVPGAADPRQRARENLAHVLLNHHEFVNIR